MSKATIVGFPESEGDDHNALEFWNFIQSLEDNDRIAILKCYRPEWSVSQIANTCGISERTVLRSNAYRRLRQIDECRPIGNSKWRGRIRRPLEEYEDHGFGNLDSPKD